MIEDGELVGDLYRVPDRWWGFEAFGRDNHPGVCIGYLPSRFKVNLLKGTDCRSARYTVVQIVVNPDESNGLLKPTSFSIKPYPFSARKILNLRDEKLGVLAERDLDLMRAELIRLFAPAE